MMLHLAEEECLEPRKALPIAPPGGKISVTEDSWPTSIARRGGRPSEKLEEEEKGKKFRRIERAYGTFVRTFTVPTDADETTIYAEFKDGCCWSSCPSSTSPARRPSM